MNKKDSKESKHTWYYKMLELKAKKEKIENEMWNEQTNNMRRSV